MDVAIDYSLATGISRNGTGVLPVFLSVGFNGCSEEALGYGKQRCQKSIKSRPYLIDCLFEPGSEISRLNMRSAE